jgi:hypothetical protein
LQVLEPSKPHHLRSKHIRVSGGEELSFAQKAVRAAAELLDIRHYEPSDKRTAAGTQQSGGICGLSNSRRPDKAKLCLPG